MIVAIVIFFATLSLSTVASLNKTAFVGILSIIMSIWPLPLPPHTRRRTKTPEPRAIESPEMATAADTDITKKSLHPLPEQIFNDTTSYGGNNCLFNAAIAARGVGRANAQSLREACDEILVKEGFPTIPKNHPAGEQYLQALSLIFKQRIRVFKSGKLVSEVCHSDVYDSGDADSFESLDLEHMGSALGGHWEHYSE